MNGWQVIESPLIPPGQIVKLGDNLVAVHDLDAMLRAVWIADATRRARADLARRVADIELRLLEPAYRSPWVT